jgi:8-amino-7-oxononanoate synthase
MNNNPYSWIENSLNTIHRANWYRSVKTIKDDPGAVIVLDNRPMINFASNNYLGLAGDKRLIEAAIKATQIYGTGSTGSRLLTGHRPVHRELEQTLASFKGTEDALVFSSGYLANLGIITALVGQRDLIMADEYNHSSLKQGAKLSEAKTLSYTHNCVEELERHLSQQRHKYRRCLITTDTIFSMDGDLCQLPQLVDLAEAYNCMLLVDEAHGTGVIGKTGAGCVEYFGCTGKPIIQMGTLSKALGSLGGYVAGSATLIDFLRNRASTWIYTTGLSPADTAAALEAIQIVQTEPQRRHQLWQNVEYLKERLDNCSLKLLPSQSPIICVSLQNAQQALTATEKLQAGGILAPAIRPPTVPTSRLRLSVMATHQQEHLDKLIDQLVVLAAQIQKT